jgi:hypothetical protein
MAQTASAELPPNPVEAGDVYLTASLAVMRINSEGFEFARRYLDDDFSSINSHSTTFDRGWLFEQDTSESLVWSPEIQFGYAFKKAPFEGKLGRKVRLHFKAYGYQRSGGGLLPDGLLPDASQLVINPVTGLTESRNIQTYVQPLDGAFRLPNGDGAKWFHSFDLTSAATEFKETFGSGDMMIYFDEPSSKLSFTRGLGLTVGYSSSSWRYTFSAPGIDTAAPGLAPAKWLYDFDVGTLYLGPRAGFAMGFEPVRHISAFFGGSFSPMVAISQVNGTMVGPCLTTCTIQGATSTGTTGISSLSRKSYDFAWDARIEGGASLYLWVIRFTGTVGVFGNNQFAMPTETKNAGFEAKLAKQWGYYGRAMATFSF